MTKAGLVDLVDDDRATLLGAFLDLAARMRDSDAPEDATTGDGAGVASNAPPPLSRADLLARWRRTGLRAFAADREAAAAAGVTGHAGEGTTGEHAA